MNIISKINPLVITLGLALLTALQLNLFFNFSGINSLIVVHVLLGALAFVIGGITLISKKGSQLHKRSGRLFYNSMVVSVALTLVVATAPNHLSPTLFHIGILSLYFLIGGKRSILFKQAGHVFTFDRLIAVTVLLVSLFIIGYSISEGGRVNPLRMVFGSIGVVFSAIDLWVFKRAGAVKKRWLLLHLSKMVGGYTAAVTAFFVAQNLLSGYFNWFVPTFIGVAYLLYWCLKQRPKKVLIGA